MGRSRPAARSRRRTDFPAQEAAHHHLPAAHRGGSREGHAWVREAILTGRFRFVEGDNLFPKHIWHVDADGQGWQGRCVNSVQGQYKGWPARPEEIAAERRKKEASR